MPHRWLATAAAVWLVSVSCTETAVVRAPSATSSPLTFPTFDGDTASTSFPVVRALFDEPIELLGMGNGHLDNRSYSGTETWLWRGSNTGAVYCAVRYRVSDRARRSSETADRIRHSCVGCDVAVTVVGDQRTELTPKGQCDTLSPPRWSDFSQRFEAGYGHGRGTFYDYHAGASAWVPSAGTRSSLDESAGTWRYRTTEMLRAP